LGGLTRLQNIGRRRPFQLAVAHVLGLARAAILLLCIGRLLGQRWCHQRGVFLENLLKVQSGSRDAFFFLDLGVVKLDEVLQFAHNEGPVVGVLSARVV